MDFEEKRLLVEVDFDDFLDQKLSNIDADHEETIAYIKSTLKKYIVPENDLSKKSITLVYADACVKPSFKKYQEIGDWTFFSLSLKSDQTYSDLYEIMGRISYHRCYKLLDRQWPLYNELANKFGYFVSELSKT